MKRPKKILNPSHSKTLVDFYNGFHEKFENYCTGIGWYNSIRHDNPIMNSTVGIFDVATIQKAQEIIFATGVFGEAEITALEFYMDIAENTREFIHEMNRQDNYN